MATAAQMSALLAAIEGVRNEMGVQFHALNKQVDAMNATIVPRQEHEARWAADATRLTELAARITLSEQQQKIQDIRISELEKQRASFIAVFATWKGAVAVCVGPALTLIMFVYQLITHH